MFDVVSHQTFHRNTDLEQGLRILEERGIAPVPGDQPQLGIDHTDALAHVFQSGLEHLLVETQRLRGLPDDGRYGVKICTLLTACGIEQQASRSRAQHRGQFPLDAFLQHRQLLAIID